MGWGIVGLLLVMLGIRGGQKVMEAVDQAARDAHQEHLAMDDPGVKVPKTFDEAHPVEKIGYVVHAAQKGARQTWNGLKSFYEWVNEEEEKSAHEQEAERLAALFGQEEQARKRELEERIQAEVDRRAAELIPETWLNSRKKVVRADIEAQVRKELQGED